MIYLTTRQVADLLGLKSTQGVIYLIRQGMLPCERVRRSLKGRPTYRLTVAEVAQYLDVYDPTMTDALRKKFAEAA